MDVGDMVGDKAAGVRTVAVCFGRRFGTVAAGMSLAAANAVLVSLDFFCLCDETRTTRGRRWQLLSRSRTSCLRFDF
jgi:hypothetical protein